MFEALGCGHAPQVFSDDYPTADGTCVRDYVDVEDVAEAHIRAVAALEKQPLKAAYNVGGGTGSSVREVLDAIRLVSGHTFGVEVLPRRPGDPARIVGQVDLIARELGWSATRGLTDMVRSAWQADSSQ